MYVIIIILLISYIIYLHYSRKQTDTHLEQLKNALLTYFLMKIFRDHIEEGPIITVFDGTTLPPLSGSDTKHACFTYIIDETSFRKSIFFTPSMLKKHIAIHKFLVLHLNTKEQVSKFFDNVIHTVSS
jgi:hypothetical protein